MTESQNNTTSSPTRATRVACKLSLVSLLGMIAIAVWLLILQAIDSGEIENAPGIKWIRLIGVSLVTLFLISLFVVWLAGFKLVFATWQNRSFLVNICMIVSLFVVPVFAAYVLYVLDFMKSSLVKRA